MKKSIYIFSAGIFLSIIAFIPSNWLSYSLPKIFLLNLTLLISYFFAFTSKIDLEELKKRIFNLSNIFIFLYFAFLFIYTVFSISQLSSFFGISSTYTGLLTYINLFLLYIFVLIFINKDREEKIINTLIASNIAISIYGLLQILNLDPFSEIFIEEKFLGRIFSFIGHPNWLAAFITLTLPLIFYKLFEVFNRKKNNFGKNSYIALILLNLINLIATVSKSGLIAVFFMALLFVGKHLISNKKFNLNFKKILVVVALIIPLAFFSAYSLKNRYKNSFESGRSTSSREIIWKSSVKMLADNPLGFGLESVQLKFPQYNDPKLWEYDNITARIDKPHSQIIELYSAVGPFGLIIFYTAMALLIIKNSRKEIFSLEFCSSLSIIGYLITNLFGFDVIPNLIVFFLILGLLTANTSEEKSKKLDLSNYKTETIIKVSLFIGILVLIITFQFNLKHIIANNYYFKADANLAIGNFTNASINFQKAIETYPYDRIYLLQAIEFFVVIYDNKANNTKDLEILIASYIAKLSKLTNNLEPELPILEAWFEAKKGNLENFKIKLDEAYFKNPYSVLTYKISASIYKSLGDNDNRNKELDKLKTILPSYWNKPETESGRIFQKNNPWVLEILKNVI